MGRQQKGEKWVGRNSSLPLTDLSELKRGKGRSEAFEALPRRAICAGHAMMGYHSGTYAKRPTPRELSAVCFI